MTLFLRLVQTQRQTLAMTPQLMQAIKLLQMSNLELEAAVREEVDKNLCSHLARRRRPRKRSAGRANSELSGLDPFATGRGPPTLADNATRERGRPRLKTPTEPRIANWLVGPARGRRAPRRGGGGRRRRPTSVKQGRRGRPSCPPPAPRPRRNLRPLTAGVPRPFQHWRAAVAYPPRAGLLRTILQLVPPYKRRSAPALARGPSEPPNEEDVLDVLAEIPRPRPARGPAVRNPTPGQPIEPARPSSARAPAGGPSWWGRHETP